MRRVLLPLVCTVLAVAFYGPLAWLAGLVAIAPTVVLVDPRRRRLPLRARKSV